MKKVIVLISVSLFWLTNSHAQYLIFSGKWKLDKTQSDFGGLPPDVAAPNQLEVGFKGNTINVVRYFSNVESKQSLNLDGSKVEKISTDGADLSTHYVKTTKDHLQIIFYSRYEVNGNEWVYHREETWLVSKDFKTLSISRITALPDKLDKVHAIYHKIDL